MGLFGILINIVLMVFNLLPIPPTDGGRIASSLLPPRLNRFFDRVEPYGLFILLALLLSGYLWQVIGPVVNSIMLLIQTLTGLR